MGKVTIDYLSHEKLRGIKMDLSIKNKDKLIVYVCAAVKIMRGVRRIFLRRLKECSS